MAIADLAPYYSNLLLAQYRTKPNAVAEIQILAQAALGGPGTFWDQWLIAYQLSTAVGPQLDTLGKYIGVSRNIGTAAPVGYFGFWDTGSALDITKYQGPWDPASDTPAIPAASGANAGQWYTASAGGTSALPIAATFICGDQIVSDGTTWARSTADNGNGFTDVTDPAVNANGIFYGYTSASRDTTALSDVSYKAVLQLKLIRNTCDGSLYSIVQALHQFFPKQIMIVDNLNMTVSYTVVNTIPLSIDILSLYLPTPMGVGKTITIIAPIPESGGELETEDGHVITTEGGAPITTESTS